MAAEEGVSVIKLQTVMFAYEQMKMAKLHVQLSSSLPLSTEDTRATR